ncbi:hypothetical protein B0H34DRAFT_517183 [Crassisporium funariophilum]|nr:hypothetical protein B0H34DRAFT_517183 [Crassisporium funariophilum]
MYENLQQLSTKATTLLTNDMFKFAALIALLAASISLAAGGDVKLCSDDNLQGHCETLSFLDGVCYNLDSDLNNELSSVDPVGSNISCILYKGQDCNGDTMGFTQHHNTLGTFNDNVSSIKCTTT